MNAVKENSMGTELISFIEKRAENAENLRFCNGIKLNHIKDCVAQMLNTIGYNNIFSQYTRHDIPNMFYALLPTAGHPRRRRTTILFLIKCKFTPFSL